MVGGAVSIVASPSSERDGRHNPLYGSLMRRDVPDIPHPINQRREASYICAQTNTHSTRVKETARQKTMTGSVPAPASRQISDV